MEPITISDDKVHSSKEATTKERTHKQSQPNAPPSKKQKLDDPTKLKSEIHQHFTLKKASRYRKENIQMQVLHVVS